MESVGLVGIKKCSCKGSSSIGALDESCEFSYFLKQLFNRNLFIMFSTAIFQGEGLSKSAIGEILGDNRPFALETLDRFTKEHKLHDVPIVPALRQYLFSFRLPGESQKINRILEKFAEVYANQNPSYGNADQAHTVAYSCIMVNTLLHNPNVKDKPSLEKYIEMNEVGIG